MALFLSTYSNKIDKKGRVSVPVSFRLYSKEDRSLIVVPSFEEGYLLGGDFDYFQSLSSRLLEKSSHDLNAQDLASIIFSKAHILHLDPEGRTSLPLSLLGQAGIDTEITFVGKGDTFELWSPKNWEQEQESTRQRLNKVTLKEALFSLKKGL